MGFNDNESENIGKNISMGIAETRLKIRVQINGRKNLPRPSLIQDLVITIVTQVLVNICSLEPFLFVVILF